MTESLKGKVAVITGVGSGFAKATAELFARPDQVRLVLIDINEAALKVTADACEAAGSKVVAFVGDVTRLKGGCVTEMLVYGLAQDVSGY